MKYKRLGEVPLPRLAKGSDRIEPGIVDLVRGLRAIGLTTTESCPGHVCECNGDHEVNHIPYVMVRFNNEEELKRLDSVLKLFNERNDIDWAITSNTKHLKWVRGKAAASVLPISEVLKEPDSRRLTRMQENSKALARFMFEVARGLDGAHGRG